MKNMLVTRSYKDKDGWHAPGTTVSMTEKEAKRVANKGGCVEEVSPRFVQTQEEAPKFSTPFDAIRDAIEKGEVTGEGAPTTEAMSERLGRPVSAKERNALFENFSAE